jgi:hypothetical protein
VSIPPTEPPVATRQNLSSETLAQPPVLTQQ